MSRHVHFKPCDPDLVEEIRERVEIWKHPCLAARVSEKALSFGLITNSHSKAALLA